MKNRFDISDSQLVSMPMRNFCYNSCRLVGVWAYFGVLERITMLETKSTIIRKRFTTDAVDTVEESTDLEKNTEFRIKWPRGEMKFLPADSEQFMLIEHIGQVRADTKEYGINDEQWRQH